LFAGGCTLAPFYHRPKLPVNDSWAASTSSTGTASNVGWRDFYGDPSLQRVIEIALENNRDLRIATLNVEAARAQFRIAQADLLPSINAAGQAISQRISDDLRAPGSPKIYREYDANVGFTAFEFDLFGRLRSLRKAALETYFSLAETRRSAQIMLISEVATSYLTRLADLELLKLTQQTLDAQNQSYAITKQRADAGIANALDLSQAETAVDTAKANLALYTRQADQDKNALELLMGAPLPPELEQGPSIADEKILSDLPQGLPSDLLERRPDIRSAEHDLKAANANIGAARAAFFPTISLTGSIGTASNDLDRLFKSGTKTWLFNPVIAMPLFNAGANFAGVKVANVEKKIEVAHYEQTIQVAFREVADALAGQRTLNDQLAAEQALVHASSTSYVLSEMRFRGGIDNYLTVIVSQRELYAAQQDLIRVKLLRLGNLVTLYKVLGGGWTDKTVGSDGKSAATAPVTAPTAPPTPEGPAAPPTVPNP
jgi:multidrug efflux system outer membrane protein